MKNLFLLFFLILFSMTVRGQITEETRSMNEGINNALILELPDTKLKLAKKWWQTYMKDYGSKPRRVKGADEMMSLNADIVAIGGSGGVDVYSLLDDMGSTVTNTVWFKVGDDYVSSTLNESQYIESEKFLMRFALYVTAEKIKIELAEEEKNMRTLQNNLEKLKRNENSYKREIEQARERIKTAEANLVTNAESQEKAKVEIEEQAKVVEEVKKRLSEL